MLVNSCEKIGQIPRICLWHMCIFQENVYRGLKVHFKCSQSFSTNQPHNSWVLSGSTFPLYTLSVYDVHRCLFKSLCVVSLLSCSALSRLNSVPYSIYSHSLLSPAPLMILLTSAYSQSSLLIISTHLPALSLVQHPCNYFFPCKSWGPTDKDQHTVSPNVYGVFSSFKPWILRSHSSQPPLTTWRARPSLLFLLIA